MLTVEEIKSYNEAAGLKDQWDEIVGESGLDASLSFDFSASLWEAHLDKKDITILVVKEAGQIMGIFPLIFSKKKVFGVFPVTSIGLLSNIFCFYNNLICRRQAGECFTAALRYIDEHYPHWDMFEFDNLTENSNIPGAINAAGSGRLSRYVAGEAPYVEITGSFDSYLNLRSKNFIANLKRHHNNCKKYGKVEIKEFSSPDDIGYAFNKIHEIEEQSWKNKAGIAIGLNEKQKKFYDIYKKRTAQNGNIRICILFIDENAVSFRLMLRDGGTVFFLKSAYKENFKHISPGSLLMEHMLRSFYKSGIKRGDLMSGNTEWKLLWATGKQDVFNLYLYNGRRAYSRCMYILKNITARFARLKPGKRNGE